MSTLAGAIDVIRHRYSGTESATDLSHLSEDIQWRLVSECARAVAEHTNTVVNEGLLANHLSAAIAYLGIREAYIYRDWQEGIGDLMIRPARVGERHFEVVGYREFESICRDDGNADWISRLSRLFENLDFSRVDHWDARQQQLRALKEACTALTTEPDSNPAP